MKYIMAFCSHTYRPSRIWGYDTLGTGQFHTGAGQLFESNSFGSEVFDEAMPDDVESSNAVFNRTGMNQTVVVQDASVNSCIANEPATSIPQ